MERLNFWKNRTVLVTGHTGFKGAWLSIWLNHLGAKVIGYSLLDYPNDILFKKSSIANRMIDIRGDINDFETIKKVFDEFKPEIVFHLAAQPIVIQSYNEPLGTLSTNIMGTCNVLECIRLSSSVKTAVIVTSDKCYKNIDTLRGYIETDPMGGSDPYSCSKGCAELIVESYRESFFKKSGKRVASARAGNVVGGGDYSRYRLIPDCIKALQENRDIEIRNPDSVRPWQHVLEPLNGYIMLAEKMSIENRYDEAWNFGPENNAIASVGIVASTIIKKWGKGNWINSDILRAKEAKLLTLDIQKTKQILGWKPLFDIDETIEKTVEWYRDEKMIGAYDLCLRQITEYEKKKS